MSEFVKLKSNKVFYDLVGKRVITQGVEFTFEKERAVKAVESGLATFVERVVVDEPKATETEVKDKETKVDPVVEKAKPKATPAKPKTKTTAKTTKK